jgi:hypothetical protein
LDFNKSVSDPVKIVLGIKDFSFNEFSVGNSGIVDTLLGVLDGLEFTNSSGEFFFSGIVPFIKFSSFIKGRLFKTIKDIHNSADGITSLSFKLEELHHSFVNEFGAGNSEK